MRQHGQVTSQAKLHGVNPQTVHTRLAKGWDFHAALTTPVRAYNTKNRKRKKWATTNPKSQLVWDYLLKNRTAKPMEVVRATGVSVSQVYRLMNRVGTPREVFEAEAQAANMSTQPSIKKSVVQRVDQDMTYLEHAGVENAIKLAGLATTTPPEQHRDGVWTSTIVVALAAITAVIVWG